MTKKSIFSTISVVLAAVIVLFSFPVTTGASGVVTDLKVEPISVIEGTNGCTDCNGDFYRYTLEDKLYYTLTFADGTVISDKGYMFEHNGVHYNFEIETDQSKNNQWTKGNTYTAIVSIGGESVEVPVFIEETPIESIDIEPISFLDRCGCVSSECGDEIFNYYTVPTRLKGTVTFKDGTVADLANTIEYNGENYWYSLTDSQSYSNEWKAGNTYIEKLDLMGVQVDVPVTIRELPIQSIEVEPLQMTEYQKGMFYTGKRGPYFEYSLFYDFKIKATLDNGEVVENYLWELEIEDEMVEIFIITDQSEDNLWTAGNTYEFEVQIGNHSAKSTVEILPTEIVSVEVKPLTIFENTFLLESEYYDESGNAVIYPEYSIGRLIEYTATYKDGEVVSGVGVFDSIKTYLLTDQSCDNIWTVGNTYKATAYIGGYKTTFDVTIAENPVESVVLDPITIKEGTNCEMYEGFDGELYNWYYLNDCVSYTINFKDGTSLHVDGDVFEYEGLTYVTHVLNDQSEDNLWTAGNTYTYTAEVMGVSVQGEVTIV